MTPRVPTDLLEIVDALLPGAPLRAARLAPTGNVHDVVLVPGLAAVRIARRPSGARLMPARMAALRAVASAGLPFAVPEPITPVTTFGERTAVAVSWLDGAALPEGHGDPVRIRDLLAALREAPLSPELRAALEGQHDGPAQRHWAEILAEDVLPRLPPRWQDDGRRRLDEAMALDPVPDALVHADLGAGNVHWDATGGLVGVLDWDLALPGDPAVDAACMAWHGWDNVRRAVDAETYERARVWDRLFGVEHLVAVLPGRPLAGPDSYVEHVVAWLERDAAGRPAAGRLSEPC
ncbi:aminoglycoside phosphotransferase family protein [Blastococcus sp. TF02A-30]|uniref:aminoglycoside phosphotransferase family protein n=1 Tax=Blastococcus sp. TF02A-30 TaxID=2250580 RepID=UPI000DE9A562|nr:aminoglycoside phosphotransferase family protein [Blastococcus sp. TF02A-30]RBY91415.1 aminoglycoside phosphotransferase family protein [Blastococcus sp. TF02A-30]